MRLGCAIAALLLMAPGVAAAQSVEWSGDLSLQGRWFPESPAFAEQGAGGGGLVIEPALYWDVAERVSFTFTPFYRYDSADSRRSHADVREAYLLAYGEWGENFWELRLGVDQLFWGVAELHNLVDIVNQFDLIEHPREEAKLGQPMAHVTLSGDWGIAELLALSFHRKRTFAGLPGRLRPGAFIEDRALYESGAEERHVDVALRYSNTVGLLDLGVSAFRGTNREPSFVPSANHPEGPAHGGIAVTPYYEQIQQLGVDAQLTVGSWLYKLEAIHRAGARDLTGGEQDYRALILGGEYTLYSVFGSAVDVTLLAEWHHDSRGRLATNAWANDVFAAAHLAFNDAQSTEIAAGLLGDASRNVRVFSVDFKRRLSDHWSIRLEAIANLSVDPEDITYGARRDSFLELHFTYSF